MGAKRIRLLMVDDEDHFLRAMTKRLEVRELGAYQ